MRVLPSLVFLFLCLTASGCAAPADELDEGSEASAYSTSATALRASTDPIEIQLASVERVLGLGLKSITLWNRDTETNGRDLWMTIASADGTVTRAWRTRENILDVKSVQFTTGRTRLIGEEHTFHGSTYEGERTASKTEFWLDVTLDTTDGGIGPRLGLQKRWLGGDDHVYTVDATTDPLSTLIGQIDAMETAIGSASRARLLTLDPTHGRDRNGKKLVLVLVDGAGYRVFPLALSVNRARNLGFAGVAELAFDVIEQAPDSRETTKRYAVRWDETRTPSIQLVP